MAVAKKKPGNYVKPMPVGSPRPVGMTKPGTVPGTAIRPMPVGTQLKKKNTRNRQYTVK